MCYRQNLMRNSKKCMIHTSGTVCLLVTFQFIKRTPANFKITIFIKNIHTNPKYPYNSHSYEQKIITLKSILTNLKIPETVFFYTLFKYLKNILTNLKIPRAMFCLYPFQILKKSILTNLKILRTIFLLISFFKYLKSILTNLKIPRTVSCSYPFQILRILKTPPFLY